MSDINYLFSDQEFEALYKIVPNKNVTSDYYQDKISQITLRDTFSHSAEEQYENLFVNKVGWWEEFKNALKISFSDYTSLGFASNVIAKNAVLFMKDMNAPYTSYDWQHSDYYRPGIRYFEGMTKIQAEMLANNYDEREYRKELIRRGGYKSAEFLGGISGVMLDPVLLTGIGSFNKLLQFSRLAEVGFFASKPILASGLVGGLQNAALVTALSPMVKYNKETYGDLYSWGEYIESTVGAFGLGFVVGVGTGTWNWYKNLRLDKKQDILKGIKSIQSQLEDVGETVNVPDNLREIINEEFPQEKYGVDNAGKFFEKIDIPVEEELNNNQLNKIENIFRATEENFASEKMIEFGNTEDVNVKMDYAEDENILVNKVVDDPKDFFSEEKIGLQEFNDYELEAKSILESEDISNEIKDKIIEEKNDLDNWNSLIKDRNFLDELMQCFL